MSPGGRQDGGCGDEACPCGEAGDGKPGLLILTQEHGSVCHSMLESPRLLEYYRTDCALMKEYDCEMADYEAVILFDLTVDALTRLAGRRVRYAVYRARAEGDPARQKDFCAAGSR